MENLILENHFNNKNKQNEFLPEEDSIRFADKTKEQFYAELVYDLLVGSSKGMASNVITNLPSRSLIFALKGSQFTPHERKQLKYDANEKYVVTFHNSTDDIFNEVVLIWEDKNHVVRPMLKANNLLPGQIHTFYLGLCSEMWRYKIGVFIDKQTLLKIPPDSGHITPEVASKFNPTDRYPCEDSWTIGVQYVN